MAHTLIIATRIMKQLRRNKRLFALTCIAPLIIVYFLKLFMDTFPSNFPVSRYLIPVSGLIVFFFSFLLCTISLVQERAAGTLERMFINGINRIEIIVGYIVGYLILITLISCVVLSETLLLFDLNYNAQIIISLFGVFWLLSIVSVMLGIFISTFARDESHIFPFIPLIILPSVFLSGLLVDVTLLPTGIQALSKCIPLYYANTIILEIINPAGLLSNVWQSIGVLIAFALILPFIASYTLQEVEN